MKNCVSENSGSVLIVTLWVITVLSLLAYGLTNLVRLTIREEEWAQNEVFSQQMLMSLSERALGQLLEDDNFDVDTLNEGWAKSYYALSTDLASEFGIMNTVQIPFELSIQATDECGKINVNLAPQNVLEEILREAGYDINAKAVAQAIVDWRDPDSDGVAEGEQTDSTERRYFPANTDFVHIEELLFVDGVNPSLFFGEDANHNAVLDPEEDDENVFLPPDNGDGRLQPGLYDLFTTYGSGILNINTASEWVLRAAFRAASSPSEAEKLTRTILRRRRGPDGVDGSIDDKPFETDEEIQVFLAEVYPMLIKAGIELGIRTSAVRYHLRVSLPERHYTLRGDLVIVREDDEILVKEWHVS